MLRSDERILTTEKEIITRFGVREMDASFEPGSATLAASLLAIVATLIAGLPVARAAWRAVRLGALDMNTLMTLAAAGALADLEAAAFAEIVLPDVVAVHRNIG